MIFISKGWSPPSPSPIERVSKGVFTCFNDLAPNSDILDSTCQQTLNKHLLHSRHWARYK